MTRNLKTGKPFFVASIFSLACHLVFAMTAGAYFLIRDAEPVRQEVRVKIIEKKPPDKPQKKEKVIQPKRETVPVVPPVQMTQPVPAQPRVQVASAMPVSDAQPVQVEQVTTPANAPQAKMIHTRALTALSSNTQPVRSVAVNSAPMASTHTVQPFTKSARVVETPVPVVVAPSQVTAPSAVVPTGIIQNRPVSIASSESNVAPVAPVAVSDPAPEPPQVASLPPVNTGPVTDPGALDGYKNGLHRRLSYVAEKHYQRSSARRANQQGKVMVSFTVLRNGEIKDVVVKEPSTYAMLNQTALEAIKQAAPFTEFPEDIVEQELNLVIPFSFKLR